MNQFDLKEKERLKTLHKLQILDTVAEVDFDDLTKLAAQVCEAELAAISFIDECRQWFKSRQGFSICETARDIAFCDRVVQSEMPLVIEDAANDPRYFDNPLVTGEMGIRFYAGVPFFAEGKPMGSFCVFGRKPRSISEAQLFCLKTLARQLSAFLDERILRLRVTALSQEVTAANMELVAAQKELQGALGDERRSNSIAAISAKRYTALFHGLPVPCFTYDADARIWEWNSACQKAFGRPGSDVVGVLACDVFHCDQGRNLLESIIQPTSSGRSVKSLNWTFQSLGKDPQPATIYAYPVFDANSKPVGGVCVVVPNHLSLANSTEDSEESRVAS